MMRTVPFGIVLALVLLAPLSAQDSALEKARAELASAKEAKDAVEAEMQASYAVLRQDFDLVRSEKWGEVSSAVTACVESAVSAKVEGDPAAALEKAISEVGLLSQVVSGRLARAVRDRMGAAKGDPPDPAALLALALAGVFPEETFDRCWDTAFLDLPVVDRWKKVHAAWEEAEAAFEKAKAEATSDPNLMVLVPRGKFTAGPWTGWEIDLKKNRAQPKRVDAFFIDVHEVTNAAYREFVAGLRAERVDEFLATDLRKAKDGSIVVVEGRDDHPVRGVTFDAAREYAGSVGKRLPTEMEWEKAARGTDGRRYPWGGEFVDDATNWRGRGLGRPTAVGASPKDKSPYGVMDLAGNVSELTGTLAGGKTAKGKLKPTDAIVYRGGNYGEGKESATTTYRWTLSAVAGKNESVGFRCAVSQRDWKKR